MHNKFLKTTYSLFSNFTKTKPLYFLLPQINWKFSIMAIHSFCHLEEPVPQNNDLKKAHLLAKKSLHLGSSSDGAKRCFVKFRLVLCFVFIILTWFGRLVFHLN